MRDPLEIIIDTREQTPWAWEPHQVRPRVCGLDAGDYALAADVEELPGRSTLMVRFALERKSLEDFVSTISTGWDRFQRELDRMAGFPARIVIVEGSWDQCCFETDMMGMKLPEHSHRQLSPQFVARRIAELSMMGVCVLFCGTREYAAQMAFRIFCRRADQIKMENGGMNNG